MRNDIIEQLMRESRRLRVGQKLPADDETIPDDLIVRVRDDLRFMLEQPGVTIDQVAKAMGTGFSRGTLSRFRNMEAPQAFSGDVQRITRGVNRFLELIARRKEARMPDGWVETAVARKILLVVAKTIELNSIGVVTGDAGRGKTMTMRAAHELHTGSILVRVLHSTRTANGFARYLAQRLNIRDSRSGYLSQTRLIEALRGTGRALLIDEAHTLIPPALNLVRDLHDECGIPIVMAGTVQLTSKLADDDLFFGQFTSRISLRYDIGEDLTRGGDDPKPLHTVEEVCKLYESDKVRFTDEGRVLLTKIANLPGLGGLRLCHKVVQVAQAAAGGEPIDAKLILKVIRALLGETFAVGRVERALERTLKVA